METKVLLVDDALSMRKRCRKLLENHGFRVLEADNGAKALLKYKLHKPDVVLMDITMPLMDGIESIKRLMRFDPAARIIVVSAMGTQSYVLQAMVEGAKTFLVKPFDAEKILGTIRSVLGEPEGAPLPDSPLSPPPKPVVESPAPVEATPSEHERKSISWDHGEYEWLDDAYIPPVADQQEAGSAASGRMPKDAADQDAAKIRKDQGVKVPKLEILYKPAEEEVWHDAEVSEISEDGTLFKPSAALHPEELVLLQIKFPGVESPMMLQGEVVRVDPASGQAEVVFVRVREPLQRKISDFLKPYVRPA